MIEIPEKININKYRLGKTYRRCSYRWRYWKSRTIVLDRECFGFHYLGGEFKYNGWKEPCKRHSKSDRRMSNHRRRRFEQKMFNIYLRDLGY